MRENFDALDVALDAEQMARLDSMDRGPEGRVGPHPDTYAG